MDAVDELYGLAYGCPASQRKDDCPFKTYDGLPFKEKVIWIQNLNEEKKDLIVEHYRLCVRIRCDKM